MGGIFLPPWSTHLPWSLTPELSFHPGVYAKPSLSAQPSLAVSQGGDVTLRCQSQYSFDQFALYKEGDTEPHKRSAEQYWANFPITAVTVAHSGIYRCYSFSSKFPYLWSAPSDPLELVVTGEGDAVQAFLLQLLHTLVEVPGEGPTGVKGVGGEEKPEALEGVFIHFLVLLSQITTNALV